MKQQALLALEDGSVFYGESIGADGDTTGEVVFNTAMTGYQEILTDPSYSRQIVTLTYPHIGNVGITPEDEESPKIAASGLVIRDASMIHSNWRSKQSMSEYLIQHNIVGIAGIDTRRLTRILREKGAQNGCIVTAGIDETIDEAAAIEKAKAFPGLKGMDLAKEVTTSKQYDWNVGVWDLETSYENAVLNSEDADYHVVALDFGVKRNILRLLVNRKCRVTVVPATTGADEILAMNPDGVFL
ncbi:MAG: carbamoyl phosphate synthase small subunit, partial [Gammaproteobacteria bacterium]|nr:carbamoyl phosphate synthase small subunit [Gammaproteobacteria bacterium]